ncbi:MAG: metal-dependent transcriptional regulator [Syntrophomonadaceae bacterium]|nr:metal-dependent transcriptional regulator [Syntrophomonadaceae bacterium]
MKVNESAENYLETILILSKRQSKVKSIDVAKVLGFTKPSVSVAMKNFRTNGLINMDKYNNIFLTEKGLEIAEKVYEKHVSLTEWLVFLGVDYKTATEDACRIEHILSAESFEAIKKYIAANPTAKA